MKATISLVLTLVWLSSYGQKDLFVGRTWAYKQLCIIHQQDTLVMYHADSAKNVWYLGRISLALNNDGSYNATDINGSSQSGSWSAPNPYTIIVDRDSNQLLSISSKQFVTTVPISYQDNHLNFSGTLLTVFYAIPAPTSICESIQSGEWTNTSTWSCGHEPTNTDIVTINPGHTITISTNSAQAQRVIYNGGTVQFSVSGAKIFVKGGD